MYVAHELLQRNATKLLAAAAFETVAAQAQLRESATEVTAQREWKAGFYDPEGTREIQLNGKLFHGDGPSLFMFVFVDYSQVIINGYRQPRLMRIATVCCRNYTDPDNGQPFAIGDANQQKAATIIEGKSCTACEQLPVREFVWSSWNQAARNPKATHLSCCRQF